MAEPGASRGGGGPPPGGETGLAPALRTELLDPAAWREGLEQYALAMHLAVTLVDADGLPLGPCLNPRPLWEFLRTGSPAGATGCPFAIAAARPCTCVADALGSGRVSRVRDRTGLVHFAVPLAVGRDRVGALVAGQAFDRYPDQLPLEQVARKLGLSPTRVWDKARLEHPVSPRMLRVYEDLLTALGGAFLQGRYHTLLEAGRRAERERADEAMRRAHEDLERRVEERTADLRAAQQTALAAERLAAIGQMVAGLAHETRNALQRGQACLAMLELRIQDRPDALDLLRRLQRSQDDLHRLYEGVWEYAAPIRLDLCACDLAALWRQAWADLAAARAGKEADLHEETGGLDLRCLASPLHLKQVFRNLLDNALAAAPPPVRIVVRCAPVELGGSPALEVGVRDNGPGFAAEQKRRPFEPFSTSKVHGTGLGLATCKRIVEAHGGRIALREGADPGAEVLITLPRRSA